MSLSHHDTPGNAHSIYRIQYDTTSIQYISIDGLIPFVTSAVTLAAMLCVTTRIDWHLTLVAVTISPILLLLSQAYRPRLRQQSRKTKDLEHSALAVIQEVLQALRVVKAFGREEQEEDRYVQRSREGMRSRLHQNPCRHMTHADPQDRRCSQRRRKANKKSIAPLFQRQMQARPHSLPGPLDIAILFLLLASECFDHPKGLQHLLNHSQG